MTERRATGKRRAKLAMVLTAGMALVGTLIGSSQPSASAAPQTKNYDVSLLPVTAGSSSTPVTVQLENDPSSTQSFGSAQISFSGLTSAQLAEIAGSIVATPTYGNGSPDWQPLANTPPGTYTFTSGSSVAIPPTYSLDITFNVDTTTPYLISFTTQVKQSNDFSGNGNNFINLTGDPVVTDYQDVQVCSGTCDVPTSGSLSSTQTFGGDPATGSAVINGPKTNYLAAGSFDVTGSLTCDGLVDTVGSDPLLVETPGTSSTSGTVSMTFPKYVVNNLANNGTPLMQVCARASYSFATVNGGSAACVINCGQNATGTQYFDGLLPNCPSNYTKVSPELCVLSRSKHAANETIVIYVSDFSDPSFW